MSDDNPTLAYPEPSDDHPTLVLPGEREPVRARRRRWPWVILAIVLVIAGLLVAAELLARSILPGVVRGIVIEQLDLPADQQLDVEAEGILLPQLIGGRLDELRLSSEDVTVGGITGAADVTASGVPLRGGDLGAASGTVRIDEGQFAALLDASELPIDEVALQEPNVTASGAFPLLGVSVPVALTVTPDADDGELLLTPVSLTVAGAEIDLEEVASRFGNLGEQLTRTQRICIADQLPAGVTIADVAVQGTTVVIDVDVNGSIVSDTALQANGVCP